MFALSIVRNGYEVRALNNQVQHSPSSEHKVRHQASINPSVALAGGDHQVSLFGPQIHLQLFSQYTFSIMLVITIALLLASVGKPKFGRRE